MFALWLCVFGCFVLCLCFGFCAVVFVCLGLLFVGFSLVLVWFVHVCLVTCFRLVRFAVFADSCCCYDAAFRCLGWLLLFVWVAVFDLCFVCLCWWLGWFDLISAFALVLNACVVWVSVVCLTACVFCDSCLWIGYLST